MTPYFSEKIKVMSFLAIIQVLYIHTGFQATVYENKTTLTFLTSYIKDGIGPWAVATFFAISGYLFFRNCGDIQKVFSKMRKRTKTLLIPFIIAAPFFPLFFVVMGLLPGFSGLVGNNNSYLEQAQTMPFLSLLKFVYYDTGGGYPWAFHLWFIRDLAIVVLLSPIIFYLRKTMGIWSVIFMLALYIIFPNVSFLYSSFWFVAGSFFLNKVEKLPAWAACIMLVAFFALSAYHVVYPHDSWKFLKMLNIALGVVSLWRLYDSIVPTTFQLSDHKALQFACGYTFFIYLYHEPFYHLVVRGLPMVLGKSEPAYLFVLFISPFVFLPIVVGMGHAMQKYLPCLYKVIVGGR